ncbi:hypothetical protein DNTS_031237 [Danionella cerebrum]|uniref:C2 domain-containing protein n=1 Tax=Danionella cerebrum TaxID=2873325 RepID=A0A553MNF1_9TELE|nr:hypothetical protein DNTS_031237 [Danionella translucida]
MPLISLDDDDQRWVPTHVNVTVLRARRLRTKGKQGSRYVYTIIQVGKEKYTTGLVEKAEEPQWGEECSFELPPGLLEPGGGSAYPPGSASLLLTVMHRVLIGLDVFLGQAVIPLDKVFQDGSCPRNEWLKLHSKAGRKEKERGELQVTVQFTRNNMTASMYDLTVKDKPRSAFGKLKDRVTGKKRDVESSSAILPGRYAALSGSVGPPFAGDGGSYEEDTGEEQRSKVKDFFLKGKLRKNSDTRSCSSLASDSSMASSTGDPFMAIEIPRTPVYSSRVMEPFRMDTAGETKAMTHKRAHSDEASKITGVPRPSPAIENLKGESMALSKSSLCINGSHVYSEPISPKSPSTIPAKRSLLEKCAPLSRSLQNLTRRGDDSQKADGRRGSIEKGKNEDGETNGAQSQTTTVDGKPVQAAGAVEGKKLRKTLFSSGRSDSLPAKPEQSQVSAPLEGRKRGWFGSGDSQNKPRLGVSSKVESSSETPCPILCSPIQPPCSLPLGSVSPPSANNTNPFTSSSPTPPSISPSNPFFTRLQQNPFFEDLIAEESLKSPTADYCFLSSSLCHHPVELCNGEPNKIPTIKRERPRSMSRQSSLPAIMSETHKTKSKNFENHSVSERSRGWDDFEAFASSRLKSPNGTPTRPPSAPVTNMNPLACANGKTVGLWVDEVDMGAWDLPPLPPRRPLRTQLMSTDSWLNRAQELAVQKEACFLSQTDFASNQHAKDVKRNSCMFDSDKELKYISTLGCETMESDLHKIDEPIGTPNSCVEDAPGSSECEYTVPETLCFPSDWETTADESLCSSPQTQHKQDSQSSSGGKISSDQNCKLKSNNVNLLTPSPRDSNNNTDIAFIDSESSPSDLQPIKTDDASKECPEVLLGNVSSLPITSTNEDIISRMASELHMFSPKNTPNDLQNYNHCSSPFEGSCEGLGGKNLNPRDHQKNSNCDPCILSDAFVNENLNETCLSNVNTVKTPRIDDKQGVSLSSNHEEQNVPLDSEGIPHFETHTSTLEHISFEDLHLRVAPRNSRSLCEPEVRSARIRPRSTTNSPKTIKDLHTPTSDCYLHDPSPSPSKLASFESLLHSDLSLNQRPSMASTPSTSALPEETQADNILLPPEQSSPHPVKPLTNSTVTVEKKAESRSVLEKLKYSISPQRSAPTGAAENEKNQLALMEARAQYQNMTNMELIALLLQQEMDMEKQRTENEQQVALLEKRDAELKKMKVQVRDLEDYIDKLLVRIMEQTPTLLQVRARPK